jgi:hypothetical protein
VILCRGVELCGRKSDGITKPADGKRRENLKVQPGTDPRPRTKRDFATNARCSVAFSYSEREHNPMRGEALPAMEAC